MMDDDRRRRRRQLSLAGRSVRNFGECPLVRSSCLLLLLLLLRVLMIAHGLCSLACCRESSSQGKTGGARHG